jgi:hypothetical protein
MAGWRADTIWANRDGRSWDRPADPSAAHGRDREELEQSLRGTRNHGAIAHDEDGPLQEDRMVGDRLEQSRRRRIFESQLRVDRFARAHHLPEIVDAKERHEVLQLTEGRGLIEVAHCHGLDTVFVEDGLRRSALGAVGVEEELRGHDRTLRPARPRKIEAAHPGWTDATTWSQL